MRNMDRHVTLTTHVFIDFRSPVSTITNGSYGDPSKMLFLIPRKLNDQDKISITGVLSTEFDPKRYDHFYTCMFICMPMSSSRHLQADDDVYSVKIFYYFKPLLVFT